MVANFENCVNEKFSWVLYIILYVVSTVFICTFVVVYSLETRLEKHRNKTNQ